MCIRDSDKRACVAEVPERLASEVAIVHFRCADIPFSDELSYPLACLRTLAVVSTGVCCRIRRAGSKLPCSNIFASLDPSGITA